ncbi:TetR/AcrR family transcriptional regulator [Lachnoclostridium phytofermentans]|uniref:Transcriptional regulator, TetR family n=1 Tax=Lachnoclostridium phytofermentans (strain ATCC 700394 / DSM 18823 / ISDg) TaxID=357809 RepID=A9KP77_LACP7|nr:TetR-like C-terminal domain-containing protein [Lachnoclostridium phytofermentans]ABX41739.1 transcriptional regulator, TetR family [Lachnoclostridium phytofermentans ISDg]
MNKSGNDNRSVRNTKKKLLTGLLSLMHQKAISGITVRELTELVDVNRGTFYFHYADIYDMISKVQEEFFQKFNEIIDQMIIQTPVKCNPPEVLVSIFSICAENREFCEIMLGPNGDAAFLDRITNIVDEKISDLWKSVGAHMTPEEYEYFNAFLINGYIGFLQKWLITGCKQSPEEMAVFAANVLIPTIKNSLEFSGLMKNYNHLN